MSKPVSVYESVKDVGLVERGRFVDTLAAKSFCITLHNQGKDVAVADPAKGLRWPNVNPEYFI